jgi:hypothetical protein
MVWRSVQREGSQCALSEGMRDFDLEEDGLAQTRLVEIHGRVVVSLLELSYAKS